MTTTYRVLPSPTPGDGGLDYVIDRRESLETTKWRPRMLERQISRPQTTVRAQRLLLAESERFQQVRRPVPE